MKPWFDRTRTRRRNVVYLRVTVPRARREAELLKRIAREQMDRMGHEERELSLSLVGDAEMRELNKEWRKKDRHTDVLSFPLGIDVGSLGDVVISLDTAKRQGNEGGWTLERELRRLLAHGLCHCDGYDHHTEKDASRMANAERRLLGEEGMVGESYSQRPSQTRISRAAKKG